MASGNSLESYFAPFRDHLIGRHQTFCFPSGEKEIVYADWTASGRAYGPIEHCLQNDVLPFFANSHTQTTITGTLMTTAYEEAKVIIKKHVGANNNDALIFCGSGMTSAVNKLQRLLGLKAPEQTMGIVNNQTASTHSADDSRPVVFVTSMEHHSNHISWLETIATVEIINQGEDGNVDLAHFEKLLEQFKSRKHKIAAVTACSNVTGIQTPYHQIAGMIHAYGGLCFVDFACSAPYVQIDMHPSAGNGDLDAVYFSMHKFLGGPGTPGVLVFNTHLYNNTIPDQPGGGTISYSNPWQGRKYITDIESREDGGTPPLLQGIKAAMCIRLKEEMAVDNILGREKEILEIAFSRLTEMTGITILQGKARERLGIISFTVENAHYNLIVKLLNDRFGIQTRGGCSCAGTYGHRLLNVDKAWSHKIWGAINSGDLSSKPGWIRVSFHPTMTNKEVEFILDAIEATVCNFREWKADYSYDSSSNEYLLKDHITGKQHLVEDWFQPSRWAVCAS